MSNVYDVYVSQLVVRIFVCPIIDSSFWMVLNVKHIVMEMHKPMIWLEPP